MTQCPKCSHKWEYKGAARFITCPHCRSIFKNPEWKGFGKNEEKIIEDVIHNRALNAEINRRWKDLNSIPDEQKVEK